ncbi:RloB family protein [uncultured Corynebacterium sp.]|uniref:RloB family protein n=1 Tax=uncultured Corynebacterium sp. TaxID=159447 RepID=UPI002605FA55|nr:RloB family protein [uncultured Corynebacterium sp.]
MAAKKKQRSQRKQQGRRSGKSTVGLLVEGEVTEREYFRGLTKHRGWNNQIALTIDPVNKEIDQMAKMAVEQVCDQTYDYAFVVVDWDETTTEQFERAKRYVLSKKSRQKVKLVITSPLFELWLCAHYVRMVEGCDKRKVLEKEKELEILETQRSAKQNHRRKHVPENFPYANTDIARKNVRTVNFNTHTGDGKSSMPKLIDFLDALNRGERPR